MPPIITLTTDFGAGDGWPAAMKGVILGISPGAVVVDISHEAPPQDIAHAAFVLWTVYRYFPPDAIHVVVVDPEVGTSRRALLLVTPHGRFVAPDNGLLSYVLSDMGAQPVPGQDTGFMAPVQVKAPPGCQAYALTQPEFWRQPVSTTFHGRDIFAPVAAHLSTGVPPADLGQPVDRVVALNVPAPETRKGETVGRVIHVDRFGNLVTSIRPEHLPGRRIQAQVEGHRATGLARSYAEGDGLLALIGSHGCLEIAARNGNAAARTGARLGSEVRVSALEGKASR